jgi:hypothetical protein
MSVQILTPSAHDEPFKFPTLSTWHRNERLRWAKQVLNVQHQLLEANGASILHHTLHQSSRHQSMHHYPKGDRIDRQTGGQYFYHCHRENFTTTEHGHFHCFLREASIPQYIVRSTPQKRPKNPMTHLVAIGVNQLGQPIRLFTVNRWVTDEVWYDAQHTRSLLKRFKFSLSDSSSWQLIDQWVEGMIHLFAPQIVWLHHQRDRIMANHHQTIGMDACYEHRAIEELSSLDINLPQYIQWLLDNKPKKSE